MACRTCHLPACISQFLHPQVPCCKAALIKQPRANRPIHRLQLQLVTATTCERPHADTQQMSGRLLCLEDSYARHCTAAVTACTPSAAGGKKGIPKSWAVQLSQTVLYPEGMD